MKQRLTAFIIIVTAFALISTLPGCGSKKKSDRSSSPAATGGGDTGGTGTGTGTGGGNSTGGGGTGSAGTTWDFKWVRIKECSAADVEAAVNFIQDCNVGLYKSTEGQGMLGDQIFRHSRQATDEQVVLMQMSGGACNMTRMRIPDRLVEHIFLHEFGHMKLNVLGEEYSCSKCNMASYHGQLSRHFCDEIECNGGMVCWEQCLMQIYSNWTHTGADPGVPQQCKVTVEN